MDPECAGHMTKIESEMPTRRVHRGCTRLRVRRSARGQCEDDKERVGVLRSGMYERGNTAECQFIEEYSGWEQRSTSQQSVVRPDVHTSLLEWRTESSVPHDPTA
eukprot:22764-Eustigmatos_ZCMA.PRE.1